ncbi:MAG TPA: DUF370 domain-containing protein [bacterium]|nr:DUF370 domain-containing protein [bacterium]
MKMVNVGFNNFVSAERIIAVLNPESAPMKRLREDARQANALVDVTQGRRTRSILLLDTGTVILSGIQEETLVHRLETTGAKVP